MEEPYVTILGVSMTHKETASFTEIVTVYRGVSIFKTERSRFWYVRVWDRRLKKYVVRSSKETGKTAALRHAQIVVPKILSTETPTEKKFTFRSFAHRMLAQEKIATDKGNRSVGSYKAMMWCIHHNDWGLLKVFGEKDVREITTADFREYMDYLDRENTGWAASTKNTILATFRNVLKVARDQRVIDQVPETPRSRQKDNPRPFFKFYPLVSETEDAYKRLLDTAKTMAHDEVRVRWIKVTDELHDIVVFLVSSFVRPITSELYAIRHCDITVADNPRRLMITIRDGKTGFRVANTLGEAVDVYERICQRHPHHTAEDYIFLPAYQNRTTAGQVIQRQFRELLKVAGLKTDSANGMNHSIYSLRHTAICRRLVLSGGKVNIFTLARNAGTSVDQIERFYARNLPLSSEMVRNLQVE